MKPEIFKVDVDKIKKVDDTTKFVYILQDEYSLYAKYAGGSLLDIYAYSYDDKKKIVKALKTYGAELEYCKEVFKLSESVQYNDRKLNNLDIMRNNKKEIFEAKVDDKDCIDFVVEATTNVVRNIIDCSEEDAEKYEDYTAKDFFDDVNDELEELCECSLKDMDIKKVDDLADLLVEFVNDGSIVDAEVIDFLFDEVDGLFPDKFEEIDWENVEGVEVVDEPTGDNVVEPEFDAEENPVEESKNTFMRRWGSVLARTNESHKPDYIDTAINEGYEFTNVDDMIEDAVSKRMNEAASPESTQYNKKPLGKCDNNTLKGYKNEIKKEFGDIKAELMSKVKRLTSKQLTLGKEISAADLKKFVKANATEGNLKELGKLIDELVKLNNVYCAILSVIENRKSAKSESTNESVTARFSTFRRVFEDGDEENGEKKEEPSTDEPSTDEPSTEEPKSDKEENKDGDDSKENKDEETIEVRAIKITVKKDAAEKCKEDMIDAGIDEKYIELIEDDDEKTIIKVDADAIDELKKFLDGKGIDLEEKLGGSIASDDDKEEKKDGDDSASSNDASNMDDLFAGWEQEDGNVDSEEN